jgi:hypothetical protein
VAAVISANLPSAIASAAAERQSADPPSGLPEKTVIESIESTESLIIHGPRPKFALAGRAAGGGRDGPSDHARPSRRDVALAAATNRYGAAERKGEPMTTGCPPSCRPQLFLLRSLRSFAAPFICANLRQSADPQPSLSAIASAAADAFCLLPFAFRLSPRHEPFRIILKEPEIRGDPS